MTPTIERIIAIVAGQQDNHAACYSRVSHAIFDDFNLETGAYLYDCATNHTLWKEYIDEQYAALLREKRAAEDFSTLLANVVSAIDALLALCIFPDADLEAAAEYLWEHGLTR